MRLKQILLKYFEDRATVPNLSYFPSSIYPPGEKFGGFFGFGAKNKFWDKVKKLRDYTDSGSENFSENYDDYEGSTGWEYEMMVAYVYKDFFYAKPTTSRDYEKVSSKHNLKIDTEQKNKSIVDKVIMDGKTVGTLRFYKDKDKKKRNQAIKNKDYHVGFTIHFHSHPKIIKQNIEQPYYTFFSPQDFETFRASRTPFMGLVTDRVWLMAQTAEFKEYVRSGEYRYELGQDLHEVSKAEKLGFEPMKQAASEFFRKYNIAGYVSNRFGGSFVRV